LKLLWKTEPYWSSVNSSFNFLEHHWLHEKWVFKDMYEYICSVAMKFTESQFKVLNQGFNHFYSTDTWKGNNDPALWHKSQEEKGHKLKSSICFQNSSASFQKLWQLQTHEECFYWSWSLIFKLFQWWLISHNNANFQSHFSSLSSTTIAFLILEHFYF